MIYAGLGIGEIRYASCHVVLDDETTIRFLSNLAQKRIVSYAEFT